MASTLLCLHVSPAQACWNDHGPSASTYLEAFYAVKHGLPVVAANAWQSSSRINHLTFDQFTSSFDVLEAAAPAQNLDRRIPSYFVPGNNDVGCVLCFLS